MWWNLLLPEKHTLCHGYRLGESTGPNESIRTDAEIADLEFPSSPALLPKVEGSFLPPTGRDIEGEGDVRFSCCSR